MLYLTPPTSRTPWTNTACPSSTTAMKGRPLARAWGDRHGQSASRGRTSYHRRSRPYPPASSPSDEPADSRCFSATRPGTISSRSMSRLAGTQVLAVACSVTGTSLSGIRPKSVASPSPRGRAPDDRPSTVPNLRRGLPSPNHHYTVGALQRGSMLQSVSGTRQAGGGATSLRIAAAISSNAQGTDPGR